MFKTNFKTTNGRYSFCAWRGLLYNCCLIVTTSSLTSCLIVRKRIPIYCLLAKHEILIRWTQCTLYTCNTQVQLSTLTWTYCSLYVQLVWTNISCSSPKCKLRIAQVLFVNLLLSSHVQHIYVIKVAIKLRNNYHII